MKRWPTAFGVKLQKMMIRLRASFWFIPSLIVSFSLFLATILIEIDSQSALKLSKEWPRLFGAGAEGSRGMLSTIATSIMTMTGLTFSMTLVALSLASSQYTSRILRTFVRNRSTQTVLGIFVGIFTYCIVVLRTIRGEDVTFVPSISIFVGFLSALVGVGVIVFFIHHIASSIQASNIISEVASETIEAMGNQFPKKKTTQLPLKENQKLACEGKIISKKTGYIQTIDETYLTKFAAELDSVIVIHKAIGDFVIKGTLLATFSRQADVTEENIKRFGEAISIQRYRTIEQDPLFGIQQIVDIALKSLSPGVNDTTSALVCIDYLTSILVFLTTREIAPEIRIENNVVRLKVKRPHFEDYIHHSFSQIVDSGKNNRAVLERILDGVAVLSDQAHDKEIGSALTRFVADLSNVIKEDFCLPFDQSHLMEQAQEVKNLLS